MDICEINTNSAHIYFEESKTIKNGNDFCELFGMKCSQVFEGKECQNPSKEHKYDWQSTCEYSAGDGEKHIAVCKKDDCGDCGWANEENTSCESDGGRFIDDVAWDNPHFLPNSHNKCYLPCGGRSKKYTLNGACPKTLLKELKIDLKGGEECDDTYNSAWIKFESDEVNSSGNEYCKTFDLQCSKVFKSDRCEKHRDDYILRYPCDLDWDEKTNLVVQCDGERPVDTGRPKPFGNAPSTASWKAALDDGEIEPLKVFYTKSQLQGYTFI